MMRIFIIVCALLLVACQTVTPEQIVSANKAAELAVQPVLALSGEVDMAEKRGWITNETEDNLQNKLIALLRFMADAQAINSEAGCGPLLTKQECIQRVLLDVEAKLRESENEPR